MPAKKNKKGTVAIINDRGRIRLRWSYNSKRFSLNLNYPYSKINLIAAKGIAIKIEMDIAFGFFDYSLKRYGENNHVDGTDQATGTLISQEILNSSRIIELFTEWTVKYRKMDIENSVDYYSTKQLLTRWKNFSIDDVVDKLENETFSPQTFNKRLGLLNSFFRWMVKRKYIPENPLEDISRKKVRKREKSERKPFTQEEVNKILEAIKTDKFKPKASKYTHSYYYPFVYFLFATGCRNAEAVGLKVKNVLIDKKLIEINGSLARTRRGTHVNARIEKDTKNGKIRHIPLSQDLLQVLLPLLKNKEPEQLVFSSITGKGCIDDRMFQRRIWKPVLKGLQIEYRVLYACRHTFASRLIESGFTPVMTAFLMGNNPETTLRHYTHLIKLPDSLPSII